MNTIITSRDSILQVCRELIKTQGWSAINIRTVAAKCGVSVGSIYNYFNSKAELTAAAIESVWHDIFHFPDRDKEFDSFSDCVSWIFDCMREGNEKYPGFFTLHSVSFLEEEKTNGKQLMEQSWKHIQNQLFLVLTNDRNIHSEAFSEVFTPEKFVNIVFSLIVCALLQQNYDCSVILELIQRSVY